MFLLSLALLLKVLLAVEVADLTKQKNFNALVGERDNVWVVAFSKGEPGSQWPKAATKLKEIVRFGRVDCTHLDAEAGHAAAPCSRAASNANKVHVLGYTFSDSGELMVSARTYVGHFVTDKIVTWAMELAPRLAVQLTAHAGTNILHKEELSAFLTKTRVAKAIIFTTSPKGEPPALVKALAVHFRQRLLLGEVKASDMTLRNSFSVKTPPAIIVIDTSGKRHVYDGVFKREPIEKYLKDFSAASPIADLHNVAAAQTEHIRVKKQSYSDAETRTYPKGFNPWTALDLPRSRTVPSKEDLKIAYKVAAKKWHPDKCRTNKKECESRMSEAALANAVLSDGRQLQQWEAWRQDMALGKHRRSDL